MPNMYRLFGEFVAEVQTRVRPTDPSQVATHVALARAAALAEAGLSGKEADRSSASYSRAVLALGVVAASVWFVRRGGAAVSV